MEFELYSPDGLRDKFTHTSPHLTQPGCDIPTIVSVRLRKRNQTVCLSLSEKYSMLTFIKALQSQNLETLGQDVKRCSRDSSTAP